MSAFLGVWRCFEKTPAIGLLIIVIVDCVGPLLRYIVLWRNKQPVVVSVCTNGSVARKNLYVLLTSLTHGCASDCSHASRQRQGRYKVSPLSDGINYKLINNNNNTSNSAGFILHGLAIKLYYWLQPDFIDGLATVGGTQIVINYFLERNRGIYPQMKATHTL